MADCVLEDLARRNVLHFQVNGPRPTFRLRTERISAAALRDLDDTALDLLDVAAAVFYSDGRISRGGDSRSEMGAAWHRRLHLTIPVRRPELWGRDDVTQALTAAVGFLTGDHFRFCFVKNDDRQTGSGFLDFAPGEATFRADDVIMFSGGLDSFAGALETLETGNGNVILVSHQSAPKVAARQKDLAQYLIKRYPGRIRHIMVPANRAGEESRDTTQRSRSFLFAAMGAAIATTFGAHSVSFFENGIVSHNLPVSPQIVGTMASRTTHPLVLARLQSLIRLILPEAPRISNPYEWMTKTEVVDRIRRYSAEKMVADAVSCTRVRDQTTIHTRCGACSQCLDRRFAILSAGLAEFDRSTRYETDVISGPRDPGATILPVEWTRHFLSLSEMDDISFLARFGTELNRILEAYPLGDRDMLFSRIMELHRRQAKIVVQVLKAEIEKKAADLASRRLPPTCLLVLHLGQFGELHMISHTRTDLQSSEISDSDEWDMPSLPGNPLTLVFSVENGRQIVTVPGLCHFKHKVARVTFVLKEQHKEDKARGVPPDDYRYMLIPRESSLQISKEDVRVQIARGRKQLAAAYRDMHEQEPPADLLFQTKPRMGYRLNPLTRIRDGA